MKRLMFTDVSYSYVGSRRAARRELRVERVRRQARPVRSRVSERRVALRDP